MNKCNYVAHKNDKNKIQSLKEHLENVSEKCFEFAIDELKPYARLCGLLHDAGKYTTEFQNYIKGKSKLKTEHARYGAQILEKYKSKYSYIWMLQYCIAGHHTGLADGGVHTSKPEDKELQGILKREPKDSIDGFYDEIKFDMPPDDFRKFFVQLNDIKEMIELYAFMVKYLFSCLTDADFIDTESFCSPETERGLYGDFKSAYKIINKKIKSFVCKTELQTARSKIQEQVYCGIDNDADVYTLDMPTGSGKTLCSMKAALELALRHGKKRIIYVVPFLSIIEQTAEVFENMFGQVLPVLQHHSNYSFDEKESKEEEIRKRTCENWDASLVVTTNIQFFESFYHYKGSRLRNLHNLADSIIVFDEFHSLPIGYLQPCLRAIGNITRYLNSKVIIMSATMLDFDKYVSEYIPRTKCIVPISDKSAYEYFKKCTYQFIGKIGFDTLVENIMADKNALIVVNTKKKAKELYNLCKICFGGETYHLSTHMTPKDRLYVINKVKSNLSAGIKTALISTSLIEAGVDLDFEHAYREIAGLDNILQAGGRCNREGKLKNATVTVFEIDTIEEKIRSKVDITKALFKEYGDVSKNECIKEYYRRLLEKDNDIIKENTISEKMTVLKPNSIPFRTYSNNFEFINNESIGVVIPCEDNYKIIEDLRYGRLSVKRKLQKYCASVSVWELEELMKNGVIEEINDGVYQLTNQDYYDENIGIMTETETEYIL